MAPRVRPDDEITQSMDGCYSRSWQVSISMAATMRSTVRRGAGHAILLLVLVGCAQPSDSSAPNPGTDVPAAPLPVLVPCPGVERPTVLFSATHTNGAAVDVYAVTAVGEVVPLTNDGKSSGPAFSPDGTSLVFARAATRKGSAGGPPPATSLWTMDVDGDNQRKLIDVVEAGQPSVSPDGSLIAFTGTALGDDIKIGSRIYVVSADGTVVRRLTEGVRSDLLYVSEHEPIWSPDGTSIAFIRVGDRDGETFSQLWSLTMETGAAELLHETPKGDLGASTWAPSGGALLVTSRSESSTGRVASSFDIAKREFSRLAEPVGSVGYSSTTPDTIAYFAPNEENSQLRLTDTSVAAAVPIALTGPGVVPSSRIAVAPCKLQD